MQVSQTGFRRISVGTVAMNKPRDSREVEIWMSEKRPMLNGELTDTIETKTSKVSGSTARRRTVTVNTSNTVKATWKGDGSSRITPPDLRRGDQVEVWQYGTVDVYYWSVLDTGETSVRKRETITHALSNTTDEKDNTPTPDNSWFWTISTHDKLVTLRTNKNDGEAHAYVLELNVKDSNFVIADDIGNYIQLNSNDNRIELETATGAKFHLNAQDILAECRNFSLNASGKIALNGQTMEVTVPKTQWEGNVDLKGNLGLTGSMTGGGGEFTMNSPANFSKSIQHQGKSIGTDHKHRGDSGGVTGGVL